MDLRRSTPFPRANRGLVHRWMWWTRVGLVCRGKKKNARHESRQGVQLSANFFFGYISSSLGGRPPPFTKHLSDRAKGVDLRKSI